MKQINNNIQESYCSFEVSKLLKEKGWMVRTHKYLFTDSQDAGRFWFSTLRDGNIPHGFDGKEEERVYIPTHSLAIEWLRVNFGVCIYFKRITINDFNVCYIGDNLCEIELSGLFNSPQEATEAALLYTLKNLI